VIDFGNGANSDNVEFDLSYGSSGYPIIVVFDMSSYLNIYQATLSISLNTWVHLAAVLNGTFVSVYVNGTYAGKTTQYIPRDVIRTSNFIGKSNWASNQLADARFKNIRIYNRSLSLLDIITEMIT